MVLDHKGYVFRLVVNDGLNPMFVTLLLWRFGRWFSRGIWTPQAGLEQGTVRAQSHAITVASLPSGSFAFG